LGRAVGTAFNVYLGPQGAEVTVSEGTVNVVKLNNRIAAEQTRSRAANSG